MRIVDLEEFLALPGETLFQPYGSYCFGELNIKIESSPKQLEMKNYNVSNLSGAIENKGQGDILDRLFRAEKQGLCLKMDYNNNIGVRKGAHTQLFAVYEKEDIEALIVRLQKVVGTEPVKPSFSMVSIIIKTYREKVGNVNIMGSGPLHFLLHDYKADSPTIHLCREYAVEENDTDGIYLCDLLLQFNQDEREDILDEVYSST